MMAMGKFTKECSEVFLFPTYDHGIKMKTYGISIVHLYISILCVLNNIFSDRLTWDDVNYTSAWEVFIRVNQLKNNISIAHQSSLIGALELKCLQPHYWSLVSNLVLIFQFHIRQRTFWIESIQKQISNNWCMVYIMTLGHSHKNIPPEKRIEFTLLIIGSWWFEWPQSSLLFSCQAKVASLKSAPLLQGRATYCTSTPVWALKSAIITFHMINWGHHHENESNITVISIIWVVKLWTHYIKVMKEEKLTGLFKQNVQKCIYK